MEYVGTTLPSKARPSELSSPGHVSDFLLVQSRDAGEVLTNLKLQKLLYYSQAWHLVLYDCQIFSEDFEAWIHGPILPSQYHRFNSYSWRPIEAHIRKPDALPIRVIKHLKDIIREFGSETAVALELMTHQEMPWKRARNGLSPTESSTAKILKDSMKYFYKTL